MKTLFLAEVVNFYNIIEKELQADSNLIVLFFMKLLIVMIFTFLFCFTSFANIKKNSEKFNIRYLQLKAQVLKQNIANHENVDYVAKDVTCLNKTGECFIAPKATPFKKRFWPNHPQADSNGIVDLPNVDKKAEKEELKRIQALLKKLSASQS